MGNAETADACAAMGAAAELMDPSDPMATKPPMALTAAPAATETRQAVSQVPGALGGAKRGAP